MDRKVPSAKRVGASVVVDGQAPVGPYPGYGGVGPYPGIGIPNGCGCPPPFFPPYPLPIFPGRIIDDRIDPPFIVDDLIDAFITAGVAPQTIPVNSTAVILLTSGIIACGGIRISGSSIILPIEGTYILSVNITATRAPGSTGGNVSFILNGGLSGSGNIASGDLASSGVQVFTGTVSVRTNARNTAISILVSNSGGVLQILGGTISVQLVSL